MIFNVKEVGEERVNSIRPLSPFGIGLTFFYAAFVKNNASIFASNGHKIWFG